MIISASRRTDIPAFYYPWLLNRFKDGEVWSVNPFNPRQVTVVPLSPGSVDAIVFWSKNPAPILEYGLPPYPWYMQYTLNDYPQCFEASLPEVKTRIRTFRALAAIGGSNSMVWRYDPIIFTEGIDANDHLARFTALCRTLEGSTNQAIISFLDSYSKIGTWMRRVNIRWPEISEQIDLAQQMTEIGRQHGIRVTACCETALGLPVARCIDPDRLARLIGPLTLPPDKGQREGCGCVDSVDIGRYDCCLHGCGYCYATASSAAALRNHARHDPVSPLLYGEVHPEAKFKYLEPTSCKSLI